jgi:hypothetical protein
MYNWCVKFVLSCHCDSVTLLRVCENEVMMGVSVPKHDAVTENGENCIMNFVYRSIYVEEPPM